jgi:hypothetical protein
LEFYLKSFDDYKRHVKILKNRRFVFLTPVWIMASVSVFTDITDVLCPNCSIGIRCCDKVMTLNSMKFFMAITV